MTANARSDTLSLLEGLVAKENEKVSPSPLRPTALGPGMFCTAVGYRPIPLFHSPCHLTSRPSGPLSSSHEHEGSKTAPKRANPHPPSPAFFDSTAASAATAAAGAAVASASVSVSGRAPPDPKGKLIVPRLNNSETQKLSYSPHNSSDH